MEELVNLVRLGHYFVPGQQTEGEDVEGTCHTALVIDSATVHPDRADENGQYVAVVFWRYGGDQDHRIRVLVSAPVITEDSFHLSGKCPWGR